jgi:hypothetical protein
LIRHKKTPQRGVFIVSCLIQHQALKLGLITWMQKRQKQERQQEQQQMRQQLEPQELVQQRQVRLQEQQLLLFCRKRTKLQRR